MPKDVLAVVVTYFPDSVPLRALVASLFCHVGAVVLVDNTPGESGLVRDLVEEYANDAHEIRCISFGENKGVASGLNAGIAEALRDGFDYVLLCDQDSLPVESMVEVLHDVAEHIRATGRRVGCVSPQYIDLITGKVAPFDVHVPGTIFFGRMAGDSAKPWTEIVMTITSGSLIPCSVFADVGVMRSDFFIDHVDTEWCHRVRHHGYSLYGTSEARLDHHLGGGSFKAWSFGWHTYTHYPSDRLYYRFRNFVRMLWLSHVSKRWKIRQCWYWLGCVYAYTLFSPGRLLNSKMIFRGILDGLRGRMGPL